MIAVDVAGNRSQLTVSYSVIYAFGGIEQPINADGSSVFKVGMTIPVKFSLSDALGNPAGGAIAHITFTKVSDAVSGTVNESGASSAPTAGDIFKEARPGKYVYDLGTKGLTAGTYLLGITLDDGESYSARVSLK